jgi:transposase
MGHNEAAIVFVVTSGCAWRHLPPSFGVSVPAAHRRFTAWTRAGLWPKLHRAMLDRLGAAGRSTGRRRSSAKSA